MSDEPYVRYRYRELFFAHNGPGPYECFHCKQPVLFHEVTVHHLDHDHYNDVPENLTAAHAGCHMTYHRIANTGKRRGPYNWTYVPTIEHRAAISAAQSGKTVSEAARAKQREKMTGRVLTAAHRAAISAANSGRTVSDETKQKMRESALKRWEARRGG